MEQSQFLCGGLPAAEGILKSGVYTESFCIPIADTPSCRILRMVSKYETDGTEAPTISFRVNSLDSWAGGFQKYIIGKKDGYWLNEWRILPVLGVDREPPAICVDIPAGVTLTIRAAEYTRDEAGRQGENSPLIFDHGGHGTGMAAFNSDISAVISAMICADGHVFVPKRTRDGEWICFHDDVNVENRLRYADGRPLPSGSAIADFTLAELETMQYVDTDIFGQHRKLVKLEAVLQLCAKHGLIPMCSLHPFPSHEEADVFYGEMKALLEKYHLLEKFIFKSGTRGHAYILDDVYRTFGNKIRGYYFDTHVLPDAIALLDEKTAGWTDVEIGIELMPKIAAAENVARIRRAGYCAGIFSPTLDPVMLREAIEAGLDLVTTDDFCSNGLNW